MRQDPPFDMSYITSTFLLEHAGKKTIIINNPIAVRNSPEKLLVTHFKDIIPKTLITSDLKELKEAVTSPGGTTEAGLNFLDKIDIDNIVFKMINSAVNRSKELSKKIN